RGFILFRLGFLGGGMTSAVPPLAVIFSAADFEKWCALTTSFLLTSPWPRMRTPSAVPLASPACRSASRSTVAPSANGLSRSTTLTTRKRLAQVPWLKPRFGMRRNSCIWPPSKSCVGFFAPALAHWPLLPRELVLPCPEPGPRPTRFLGRRL